MMSPDDAGPSPPADNGAIPDAPPTLAIAPAPVHPVGPVIAAERIVALDVLRGFALLGILVMNIQTFAMIEAAYMNPTAFGDLSGLNGWVWKLSHLLADQKFMTIFSLLFGAGIVLMSERAEAATGRSAGLHYRRCFWLIVIGLLHAHLLWYGDILFTYGMCGLVAYLFRRLPPGWLITLGVLSLAVSSLIFLFFGWSMTFWPPEAIEQNMAGWAPPPEAVAREIDTYQGGWWTQMRHRVPTAVFFETFLLAIWGGWRAGGLMLIGMALYRLGVVTARRSTRFYAWMIALGLGVGLPVVALGMRGNIEHGWSIEYSWFLGWQYNYWGSLFVSAAYIGAIMLVCRRGVLRWLLDRLAAVGRTALSNYLLQTIICTTILYGHGLALFGRVPRTSQILIVVAVWVVQLSLAPLWLRHFRFGPFEWIWRSLSYLERQPLRRAAAGG
jgi:uncharacterized protein